MERDRNLLFGVFAIQLKKITPSQLVEAAAAWAADQSRDLPERFVTAGALSPKDRDLIAGLVDAAVSAHAGDASATLKTFGGEKQVYESFSGSIVLSRSGEVKVPPTATLPIAQVEPDTVPAVQETPGRYSHAGEYSRGAMGRVLLVHDQHLLRDVALKELLPEYAPRTEADTPVQLTAPLVARFLQEARITGQLEHPSIVPVYELGYRRDGTLYYTMKLVRGKTLSGALEEAGSLSERMKLLPHFVDLCQAVAYAHSRGVVHRDIKPQNVMVGEFGETVVIDWGLAKVKGREDIHANQMEKTYQAMRVGDDVEVQKTAYGGIIGTPLYAPPEQIRGQLDCIDERSDVYSLGAVLYEFLTGQAPFKGARYSEIVHKVTQELPASITELEPNAPPELMAVCRRAMQKAPAKRYQSSKELADDVARFQTGGLVRAYTYKFGEHLHRFVERHRAVLGTIAIAAVLLMAFNIYSYVRVWQAKQTAVKNWRVAERELYLSNISLAEKCIKESRVDQARGLLAACPKEHRHWEWGRLQYLCNLDDKTVTVTLGEQDTCHSFNKARDRYAIGKTDGTVVIWDLQNEKRLKALKPHSSRVTAVALSPDGSQVASAAEDLVARIWDVESETERAVLRGHTGAIQTIAFAPDAASLATASDDGSVKVWNAATGAEKLTIQRAGFSAAHVAFSPDRRRLAIGWWGGTGNSPDSPIAVWDLREEREITGLPAQGSTLFQIAFSNDGKTFAAAYSAQNIVLRETDSWNELETIRQHGFQVTVDFSPDDTKLVIGMIDALVVWDIAAKKPVTTVNARGVGGLFAAAGKQVITREWLEGSLRYWEVEGGPRETHRLESSQNIGPWSLAFSPDGKLLAAQHWDGSVKLWHCESFRQVAAWQAQYCAGSFSFSPDGKCVPLIYEDRSVALCNVDSGKEISRFAGHEGRVSSVDFSADGRLMATGSEDGTARVWDVATQRQRMSFNGNGGTVRCVAFSPNYNFLATANDDGAVRLWNLSNEAEVRTFAGHQGTAHCVQFSPDGSKLASGAGDRTARIWDAATGETLHVLGPHGGPVVHVAFSPDGERLATVGHLDNAVKLWDTETGRELLTLDEHTGATTCVAFSPDGAWLASGGADSRIFVRPAFPTKEEDYPGGAASSLAGRIEQYKRGYWNERRQVRERAAICDERLAKMDLAKLDWAISRHVPAGESPPSVEELVQRNGSLAQSAACPSGGTYVLGAVGEPVRCSVHGPAQVDLEFLAGKLEELKDKDPQEKAVVAARLRAALPSEADKSHVLGHKWALVENRFFEAALVALRTTHERVPDNGLVLAHLAQTESLAGYKDEAEEHFRKSWELGEKSSMRGLLQSLLARGRQEDLEEAYRILAAYLPDTLPEPEVVGYVKMLKQAGPIADAALMRRVEELASPDRDYFEYTLRPEEILPSLRLVPMLLLLPEVQSDLKTLGGISLGPDAPPVLFDHGMKQDDTIESVNDVPVSDSAALQGAVQQIEQGAENTIRLGFKRGGRNLRVIYRIETQSPPEPAPQ